MNDWAWLERLDLKGKLIVTLLDQYQDVVEGVRELGGRDEDSPLRLMCAAWNHPSFQQLERLRTGLRSDHPVWYWHLAERWLRASTTHVCECPKCLRRWPVGAGVHFHRHGRDNVNVTTKAVKAWSAAVQPDICRLAVSWLEGSWVGEPFLPEILRHLHPDAKIAEQAA